MLRSRGLRIAGIALAGVLLTAAFIYLGFPYDRLADVLSERVRRETGVELAMASLGPSLALAGPGLGATGVDVRLRSGERLTFDRARVRAAWSLSWLRGAPALHTGLESPLGEAEGVVTLNGAGAWRGELRRVALAELPLSSLWRGLAAEGMLDGKVDLRFGDEGPEGSAVFEAFEGSLTLPSIPVAVPFEHVEGELAFGGGSLLSFEKLALDGPLLQAKVGGRVTPGATLAAARLALEIEIRSEPGIRSLLESAGVRFGRDGSARVRIGGTVARPVVR